MKKLFLLSFLVFSINTYAQISLMEFKMVSDAFHEVFSEELKQRNSTLYINRPPAPQLPNYWWDLDVVHASYTSFSDESGTDHNLYLFGGYARMEGMTMDGVTMTLCHELGHGIGGYPMKNKDPLDYPASTEGQSDYYAARHCIKRIFKVLPESAPVLAPTPYTEELCLKHFNTDEDIYLCHRGFQTLEVEKIFLRTQVQEGQDVDYDTPDTSVVTKMDLSPTFYPSAQCRLDTMVAGILEQERPRCWWAP